MTLGLDRDSWSGRSRTVASEISQDITYLNKLRCQHERNLHALLPATTRKAFTEPKDRIFALLGVLSKETISLDYALDIRVIYTSTAMHCIATQGTFDILFGQWERSYKLNSEADSLHSCLPNFGQSHGTRDHAWHSPHLMRPEQGRWESARVTDSHEAFSLFPVQIQNMRRLTSRDASMNVIENLASRCRISFESACVTTVSKLYCFGQHSLDWILADLSRSRSRNFANSPCERNKDWHVLARNKQEKHAYDLYTLLLESCSLYFDGDAGSSVDLRFDAQRLLDRSWNFLNIAHDPEEYLEFLAIADECLRRPWSECLTGPLASRRRDWTLGRYFPKENGEVHEVLQTLLLAVLEYEIWSGTFFVTSDGYLGIGPESTQPGDQIVVLDGARSPFISRALRNADYALLGDSHVLGLIHGEVRDLDVRGEFQFEDIILQ